MLNPFELVFKQNSIKVSLHLCLHEASYDSFTYGSLKIKKYEPSSPLSQKKTDQKYKRHQNATKSPLSPLLDDVIYERYLRKNTCVLNFPSPPLNLYFCTSLVSASLSDSVKIDFSIISLKSQGRILNVLKKESSRGV